MCEWISGYVATAGYFGIALLIFVEGIFPPVPSRLIMPLAGFAAGKGELDLALVIVAGSLGSLAGTLPWYAVFLGQLIPAVRTLISVPAGIVGMALPKFLIYSSLGSILRTTLLASAGYLLGDNHQAVAQWLNPVSTAILAGLVAWYIYRVITFKPGKATATTQ